jgi:hypothetical protein
MANFKTCSNGHNYDAGKHNVCPFCPQVQNHENFDKTLNDFRKTQGFDEMGSSQFDKTMINEETLDMKITPTGSLEHPFKRTNIVGDDPEHLTVIEQSEKRKLVGWLVSFSNDTFGQDYRLFVGKNKIGSAADCDIIIKDSSVSGDHTTILFRDNEFLIKDNFSTNGTKINGKSIKEDTLKEGDEIKLGNTAFKFKTVF